MNYEQMTSRLAIMMGGRVAEELIFGKEQGHLGRLVATSSQATKPGPRHGHPLGLSPTSWALVAYGENQEEVFLGHSVARTQNVSEETAKMIDAEVKRLVAGRLRRGPPHPDREARRPAHPGQGAAGVRDPDAATRSSTC